MKIVRTFALFFTLLMSGVVAHAAQLESTLQDRFGEISTKLISWEIFAKCSNEVSLGRVKFLMDDVDGAESGELPVQLRYDEFVFNSMTNRIEFQSESSMTFDPYIDTVANCSFSLQTQEWNCRARSIDITPFKSFSELPAPEVVCPQ